MDTVKVNDMIDAKVMREMVETTMKSTLQSLQVNGCKKKNQEIVIRGFDLMLKRLDPMGWSARGGMGSDVNNRRELERDSYTPTDKYGHPMR